MTKRLLNTQQYCLTASTSTNKLIIAKRQVKTSMRGILSIYSKYGKYVFYYYGNTKINGVIELNLFNQKLSFEETLNVSP